MLIIYNLVFINKMSSWLHRRCIQRQGPGTVSGSVAASISVSGKGNERMLIEVIFHGKWVPWLAGKVARRLPVASLLSANVPLESPALPLDVWRAAQKSRKSAIFSFSVFFAVLATKRGCDCAVDRSASQGPLIKTRPFIVIYGNCLNCHK